MNISKIMRDIAVMQIINVYEAIKGPASVEFINALKKASASELTEAASYLPAIIQTAILNQAWQDYEREKEKQSEPSTHMAIIKKMFEN